MPPTSLEDSSVPPTASPTLAAPAGKAPPLGPPDAAPSPVVPLLSEAHLARLQQLLRIDPEPEVASRRRPRRASARQGLQQTIRQEAVACYHTLREEGQTLQECGRLLHLSPRTLRFWDQDPGPQRIGVVPVGRPSSRSPLPVRQAILAYLKLTGPGVGLPMLQEQFGAVPRRELADLLQRYRTVCHARYPAWQRVLHWQTPGRVWAADFTEPSRGGAVLPPVAGHDPYVLAVRDLASGMMLAWQPLADLTEEVTRAALRGLFVQHGPPLVLKMDNGSSFRAGRLQEFLEGSGVIPLYSPPSCPSYNGAIEAAIGSLKKRTEQHACQQGHSGRWELTDLAAAQAAANAGHPRRLNGRTPTSLWETRTPVGAVERVVFALTVERQRYQARTELGIDLEESLDHWRGSAVDRTAIERALVEHGHLLFTRRRLPLRITARKMTADG